MRLTLPDLPAAINESVEVCPAENSKMEEIPGSASSSAHGPNDSDANKTTTPPGGAWWDTPRWKGLGKPPMTPPRTRMIAAKRAFERNEVPLEKCVSGRELVRLAGAGKLFPYALTARGVDVAVPWPLIARGKVHPRWLLTGTRVLVLSWLATAQVVRKAEGVVITHEELGRLCGVKKDRIGQVMHDLRSWGLVRRSWTFEPHGSTGVVTSQRANCYRLTASAVLVYGLRMGAVPVPEAEPDVTPRIACAHKARTKLRSTPEITPDKNPTASESAHSLRAAHDRGGVVSSATPPTVDGPDLPDAAPRSHSLEGVKMRTDAFSAGSSEPESRRAAQRIGDAVGDVRELPRRPDGTRGEPPRRPVVPDSDRAERRDRAREDGQARHKIRDIVDRRAPRLPLLEDGAVEDGVEPGVLDSLRRYRESLEDERRDREPELPRPRRQRPDDFSDVIERAVRSSHRGGGKLTPYEEIALKKLREQLREDDDGKGGAK